MTQSKPRKAPAAKKKAAEKPAASALLTAVNEALDLDEYGEAIALLTAAIEREPENAALLQSRGAVHVMVGAAWSPDPGEAEASALRRGVADLTRALELHPTYAAAYLNRGLARRAQLDREGALADMTRALELGLEPPLAIQAYAYRSTNLTGDEVADIQMVNTMRRDWRRVGKTWRQCFPQRLSLSESIPGATE
jgi:tetratricopeptide (TPR) repeat protein